MMEREGMHAGPKGPNNTISLFDPNGIEATFKQFHRLHPEVYGQLVDEARKLKALGFKTYGIGSLFEVLRWHHDLKMGPDQPFKLNNNFRSRYARLIMDTEPDLCGFFNTRQLLAA